MSQIAREAAFHRAALLLGITTGAEVIDWADRCIAENDHVPAEMLELSTISPHDLSELRHALEPMASREEDEQILRALFDRVRRDVTSGRRSLANTVTVLSQARRFLALPLEYFTNIDTLQDDHMLAVAGIGRTTAAVEQQVHRWLEQFEHAEPEFHSQCARS